jgi:lipopolysaccharide assembly outer membrane protein LptD (OstA)
MPALGALVLLCGSCPTRAQARATAPLDSLAAQSRRDTAAVRDTLRGRESPSGVDSIITYTASDSVVYNIDGRTMFLYGKGDIKYKELGLKAERIDVNWTTSTLRARGIVDTSDTTGKRWVGMPVLMDGGETYHGSTIAYNFKSKKGRIDLAKTEIERGLYTGEAIQKSEGDVLFVRSGRFTTCELDHPHFYFGSPEMKVVVQDKVVARPVYFYIADVPVFILPFGIFPSQRGRRSGVIMPGYGESTRGRYLTHLGYYWATNDYADMNIRGDFYTNGSYTLYSDIRYALRYAFTGGLSASYGRVITGELGDPGYSSDEVFNVHLTHNQDFDPTLRLVVDFMFTSATYYQSTSYSLNDLLQQNIVSNATLSKYWEGTPNSLTLNIHRDQNLQAQEGQVEITQLFPSLSFNRSQSFPFRSSKRGASATPDRWYEFIGYTYNGQLVNSQTQTKVPTGTRIDSRPGIQHIFSFNASPRAGYVTVTPFFNLTSKWYNERMVNEFDPVDSVLRTGKETGFRTVNYFDMGVSVSTKLYGILQPGMLGITGIRHQLVPSLSFTYMPDFSEAKWGYYGSYVNGFGEAVKYGYYDQEVFGGAPAGKRQAISFSLGNVFEMKTVSADSGAKENKFQLLILNLGLGYNFAADSLRLSELGMDFRTSIGQLLTIGGGGRFNFYAFEPYPQNPQTGRRVDKFLVSETGRLAELTNLNLSIGTRLSGSKIQTSSGPTRSAQDTTGLRKQTSGTYNLYREEEPDFSIPWNLDLMWSYSISQTDPRYQFRSSTLLASLGFNLTESWKINATSGYDILNRQFTAPQITIYRDLHCWEMNFSWVPIGQYRNFRVEIRLKAPQLQDVKVTKQGSVRGIY